MASAGIEVAVLRFGAFELDLKNNQLRRGGVLLKLSPQQFRVLRMLAERPGLVCSREEIQREIWGGETFVDFDRSLNVCVAQIRSALNDDSEAPRYIQTVPRQGYRFVAPVEQGSPAPARPAPRKTWTYVLAAAALVCAGAVVFLWLASRPAPRILIAVLPFENITGVADDAPLIEGLGDELIGQFGALQPESLGVIGRTSVMRYRDHRPDLRQTGRELGVGWIVEGDLRSAGGRVRISARLVETASQRLAWTETYEREESLRFELQEEIAAHVSAAVVRLLLPRAEARRVSAHTPDRRAIEAFANGRYLQYNSRNEAPRAIGWFEEAARLDPAYAEPRTAMAQAYVSLAMSGRTPAAENLENARRAAQKALLIDEHIAEAHNALADVLFWRDWNWRDAGTHFQRALALNPSLAQAWHDQAFLLAATGHAEAAVGALRRAVALDPLSPRVNVDAGWVLLQAHHFDEAIAQAKRARELEPGLAEAAACIARAELFKGKADPRAAEFYRSILDRPAGAPGASEYNRALAFAVLGRKQEALGALQSAFDAHEAMMALTASEPAFDSLHPDPRFREIVRKLGL